MNPHYNLYKFPKIQFRKLISFWNEREKQKKVAVWIIVFISMIRFSIETRIIPFLMGKDENEVNE